MCGQTRLRKKTVMKRLVRKVVELGGLSNIVARTEPTGRLEQMAQLGSRQSRYVLMSPAPLGWNLVALTRVILSSLY